jgi:hypothetical protein
MDDSSKAVKKPAASPYKLEIPITGTDIKDFKPEQGLKVLVMQADNDEILGSQVVNLSEKGSGKVSFTFAKKPGAIQVYMGPETAEDDEIPELDTPSLSLTTKRWTGKELKLEPWHIPPYYWHHWKKWCRYFTVRGRVLCSNGLPVPGAKVCAYDIDAWWWHTSKQLVGCAFTDADGTFEITFKWCCRRWHCCHHHHHYHHHHHCYRHWEFSPEIAARIAAGLERFPYIGPFPPPGPRPDPVIFKNLLGEDEFSALDFIQQQEMPMAKTAQNVIGVLPGPMPYRCYPDNLREKLLKKLPHLPEMEALRIWPWWHWHQWQDCTPDIIFQVTQDCNEPGTVIVNEGYFNTRWNIPTDYDAGTLVANEKACCREIPPPPPDGYCVVPSHVCGLALSNVGGNQDPPLTPAGYYAPGIVSNSGDRPFAERVLIRGQVGQDVDYYDFQLSDDGGANWQDMLTSSVGDIPRLYLYIPPPPAPVGFIGVPFLQTVDGHLVYESRQHYEETHYPLDWGSTRIWMANNLDSLINWNTMPSFLNGTYRLRIRGWKLVNGQLTDPQILPICNTQTENEIVLTIDNRIVGAGSGHPASTPDHPCGEGTVHTCTLEPDTGFGAVRIRHTDGSFASVIACQGANINDTDELWIDFYVYDPAGHLAYYTIDSTYGENLVRHLVTSAGAAAGVTLTTPIPGEPPLPGAAADYVGPGYAQARSAPQNAAAPTWEGGWIRLKVNAKTAFPVPCCYQLELRAHKRTIICNNYSLWNHVNYSEYSFRIDF